MVEADSFTIALEEIKRGTEINVHAANVKYNFPKSTQFEENIYYVCGVTVYTEEE